MTDERRRRKGTETQEKGTAQEKEWDINPERGTLSQTEVGVGVPDSPAAGPFIPPLKLFSGGKLTPALGEVGGGILYPSLSLNIAWQGGRKGVPGLGCSPLLFPIPARAT